jgi:hypothetical protein
VNVRGEDVPPPGAGFETVIVAVRGLETSHDEMLAVSVPESTKVVERYPLPFHRTCEEVTNPLPVTVSVNEGPPASTLVGDSEVSVGTGLGG